MERVMWMRRTAWMGQVSKHDEVRLARVGSPSGPASLRAFTNISLGRVADLPGQQEPDKCRHEIVRLRDGRGSAEKRSKKRTKDDRGINGLGQMHPSSCMDESQRTAGESERIVASRTKHQQLRLDSPRSTNCWPVT